MAEFGWKIETLPGGPKENVTGTVQDIFFLDSLL